MTKNIITLTIIANMTSNYGEGLGNISSVQKIFRNGKAYAIRSRESLKNAIMVQSGMYKDLQTTIKKPIQKLANEEINASNCRALDGGYMNTSGSITKIRKSSFYLTDAISTDEFMNETRFHNNLYLASKYAKANNLSVQDNDEKSGLMPYQYEYDKTLKIYSMTIDLSEIGTDVNFDGAEASKEEKAKRVISLLEAVENLSLVVKGNLDNAEPIFVVGGLSNRKTHYFENVVKVFDKKLIISEELKARISGGFSCGLLKGENLLNEIEITNSLQPVSVGEFFKGLKKNVNDYYEV